MIAKEKFLKLGRIIFYRIQVSREKLSPFLCPLHVYIYSKKKKASKTCTRYTCNTETNENLAVFVFLAMRATAREESTRIGCLLLLTWKVFALAL